MQRGIHYIDFPQAKYGTMTAPKSTKSQYAEEKHDRGKGPAVAVNLVKAKEHARKQVEIEFKLSTIPDHVPDYPTFDISEILHGKVLGKGGFGTVSEIRAFIVDGVKVEQKRKERTKYSNGLDISADSIDESEHEATESRLFIAQHCLRKNREARYAIKVLSPEVVANQNLLLQGMMDMALETRFLGDLDHPNIVKLRGISECDPFNECYFLVMDRLYDTLENRIQKTWIFRHKNQTGFLGKKILDRKGKKRNALYEERIVYAYDLAAAINYLHRRSIIYRDLKPENVGFDVRDDIKVR